MSWGGGDGNVPWPCTHGVGDDDDGVDDDDGDDDDDDP